MTAIDVIRGFDRPDEWDEYVSRHPEGRFCQLYASKCIERIYGYRAEFIAFRSSGRIVGVLPFFEVRSLLFGKRLVSQPFSEYGGFLLDSDLLDDDRNTIIDYVLGLSRELGCPALEMHGNLGLGRTDSRFGEDNRYQLAYLKLQQPADELWNKVISRHVRKAVRKAEREGVRTMETTDARMLRAHFYPLYLQSMTRLGAPAHSIDYFLESSTAFGERMRIFWAIHRDEPIAALLGFSCGERVSIVNIVSDERYWHLRPNDLIHWKYIKWACDNGYRFFDFGSVRYEGQAQFKGKWGCDFRDSGYYFLRSRPDGRNHSTFDSSSRTMVLAAKTWAKCMPLPLARGVGPLLRKHLIR